MNLKYPTHAESAFYANPYSRDHFIDLYDSSYASVPPVWCDYCEFSAHDACSCPYRDYFHAQCASVEKRINELTAKMVKTMKVQITEYSHSVTQSRENCNQPDSSLRSPKPEVSLYEDFEPSYYFRSSLNDDLSLPSLEQEDDLPMSLSPDLAPHMDVTEKVLVYANPTTIFDQSSEFAEDQESEHTGELDMSIPSIVELHDLNDSNAISQESREKDIEPSILDFDDDILSIEYESFSCGFDITTSLDEGFCVEYESFSFNPLIPPSSFPVKYDSFCFDINVSLDVDLCAEYESFSFNPIQANLLFESHKSKFIESEAIVTEHFDLD